jgi:hypothetical protein
MMDETMYRKQVRNEGTDGLALFDAPATAPAQRHSATSLAAAESIAPALSQKRRDLLVWIIERRFDGATDNELIADLVAEGWSPNTPRPRRVELVKGGWLEAIGEAEGSTVWAATAKAKEWHRESIAW